jgi:hypothetical protein
VHAWLIRMAILGAIAATALFVATVGAPAGVTPSLASQPNGFSQPLEAHVVPRPIDVDLTSDTSPLHRVPCAIAGTNRACFAR